MGSWLTRINQKDFDRAVELYEKGNVCYHNEDYNNAIVNYLNAAEHIQGSTISKCVHRFQCDLNYQLSLSYLKLKSYTEALFINDRAETTARNLSDDTKIALILDLCGCIKQQFDLNNEALDQFKLALKYKREVFPEHCLHIAISCHHICNTYVNLNEMDKALLWYRKAIDIQNNVLEESYIDLSHCYHTIGKCRSDDLAIYDEAKKVKNYARKHHCCRNNVEFCTESQYYPDIQNESEERIKENIQDLSHRLDERINRADYLIEIAVSNHKIGLIHVAQGNYITAIKWFQKSLDTDFDTLTSIKGRLAKLYDDIAYAYFKLDKYDYARAMYQKGLDIKLEVHGQNHPFTIQSYSNIGACCFRQFQPKPALANYEKAIKAQSYTIGPNDSNIKTNFSIATIYATICDDPLSTNVLQKASKMFEQLQLSSSLINAGLLDTKRPIKVPFQGSCALGMKNNGAVYNEKKIKEINHQNGLKYIMDVQEVLLRQNFLPIKIVRTPTVNKSILKDVLSNRETISDVNNTDMDREMIMKIPCLWARNDSKNLINAKICKRLIQSNILTPPSDTTSNIIDILEQQIKFSRNKLRKPALSRDVSTSQYHYIKLQDLGCVNSHTLQPFNRNLDIYILLFDIDYDITLDQDTGNFYILNDLHLELVQEWLKSIIPYHNRNDPIHTTTTGRKIKSHQFPVIVLVGTHNGNIIDTTEQKRRFDCYKQSIINCLPHCQDHLYSSQIVLNCNRQDNHPSIVSQRLDHFNQLCKIIDELRTLIELMLSPIPFPYRILAAILDIHAYNVKMKMLGNEMLAGAISMNNVITRVEMLKLVQSQKLDTGSNDLNRMLDYLHCVGKIIYDRDHFQESHKKIITAVDWIMDLLHRMTELHPCPMGDDHKSGKITMKCIDCVLDQFHVNKIEKIELLEFMQNNNMIYPINTSLYFMPHLIIYPRLDEFDFSTCQLSECLYIGYDEKEAINLPDNIFNRLIVSCYKRWNSKEIQVYKYCVKYSLNAQVREHRTKRYKNENNYSVIIKKHKLGVAFYYDGFDTTSLATYFSPMLEYPHNVICHELITIVNKFMRIHHFQCHFYKECPTCLNLHNIGNNPPYGRERIRCSLRPMTS